VHSVSAFLIAAPRAPASREAAAAQELHLDRERGAPGILATAWQVPAASLETPRVEPPDRQQVMEGQEALAELEEREATPRAERRV
jgi:hypothetical protein